MQEDLTKIPKLYLEYFLTLLKKIKITSNYSKSTINSFEMIIYFYKEFIK